MRGIRVLWNGIRVAEWKCVSVIRCRRFSTLMSFEGYFTNVKKAHEDLGNQLMNTSLSSEDIARISREYSSMGRKNDLAEKRSALMKSIDELTEMEAEERNTGNSGSEMAELVQIELEDAQAELRKVEEALMKLIMPRDEADDMPIVLEVRAGTGGEEASLFSSEVFKMYERYAALQGWRWEVLELSRSDIGGFTSAQAHVSGEAVYQRMKFESGVHRVQRVPVNDTKIQTSAASVIVLPEPTEVDVVLRPQDIRVDLYRSQGAGGQSVNTTDSAVRLTHIPTGVVVAMQDERSQIQNKKKAMQILRTRVYDLERMRLMEERADLRSKAQGTGDRSDKIRTYNFPQDRITDHRIGLSTTGVERVMSGENLDHILTCLLVADEEERLENFMKQQTQKAK